ncbi:unnamed protein product [Clonostachys solani]|uniref:F-box domain-containing protein n=1 Tax=Clonostachys solani TaxID=160281 RepID=A0A9N9W9Y1_9HYPO|nr:unnamed protein product [Clonostachys solani]
MATCDTVETPGWARFALLPGELKNNILTQLDAIGLVSLSQTNHYFHTLIKPRKRELGERLLAIEDRRQHQAHALRYQQQRHRKRSSREPQSKSWEIHEWALTGDGNDTVTSRRRGGHRGVTGDGAGVNGHGNACATSDSRIVSFRSSLDRFYPGLERVFEPKRPMTPHAKDCADCRERSAYVWDWMMYMARCPRCEQWQELREFRDAPATIMALPPDSTCNSCFAVEFGCEALGEDMLPRVKGLIGETLATLERRLTLGGVVSGTLWNLIETNQPLVSVIQNVVRMSQGGPLTRENVYWLSQYHGQYLKLRAEVFKTSADGLVDGFLALEQRLGFVSWSRCFDQLKAEWLWLGACEEEADREPALLAEWALARDGASLE